MSKYSEMAKAAKVSKPEKIAVTDDDSAEIKKLKKLDHYNVDFSSVDGAPIQQTGVYAESESDARKQAAQVLEDFETPPLPQTFSN